MIHAELITTTSLDSNFHKFAEQINGQNPAEVVQAGKRPRSKLLYTLAYFRAFMDPQSDTSDIQSLLGAMSFGLLCAGGEVDMAEVTGEPHGLRCLSGGPTRRGTVGVIMIGNGDKWALAIRNAGSSSEAVKEWGMACYQQFAKHDMADLFGTIHPRSGTDGGYFLN